MVFSFIENDPKVCAKKLALHLNVTFAQFQRFQKFGFMWRIENP